MFYSEALLSKTGPLARVWLSANIERKLSKTHVLQSNLQDSVEAIITPTQAPMALRLSGQLLLGVVRIYSRKARYLLDDCNEALMKIKMAFRSSGNNDMPANLHVPNREALLLPDRITPYDNLDLLPPPDAGFLLSQSDEMTATPMGRKGRVSNREINLQEDFNNSQFLQEGMDKDDDIGLGNMDDLDLELDFGMDLDERPVDRSVEMGRDVSSAPAFEDDIFSELGAQPRNKDNADRALSLDLDIGEGAVRIADDEGDIRMDGDDFNFNIDDPSVLPGAPVGPDMSRARISESPLSDVNEEDVRLGELEFSRQNDLYEHVDEADQPAARQAPQRAKKRRILLPDEQTMLATAHIREQQERHDNILKPQSFLPRDPYVLGLMEMQKSGGFVTSILMDGRSANWAPELRGLLSLEIIRRPNDLKRKRDSGIADMETDQEQGASKSPRLDLGADEGLVMDGADFGNQTAALDATVLEIPGAEDNVIHHQDDDEPRPVTRDGSSSHIGVGDMPAAHDHTASSELTSLEDKHAVHVLRDLLGAEAATNADKRKKASVVFQDLVPEDRTSKADATKMFFECLVLATKDAIKVEQPEGTLGGPIRIRGKRGLWGEWAEREAGGEIAAQMQQSEPTPGPSSAPASGPAPAIASGSATVAVSA